MQNSVDRNRQVNIWEIANYLGRHWRWYVSGGLIGLLIGVFFYWVLPPKFEASTVLQPARVGSITGGFANPVVQGNELEPAAFMVERLKQPGFFSESMRQRCDVLESPSYQKVMANELSASMVKLQNQPMSLAKISWKASSPEIAKNCVLAIVDGVVEAQSRIAAPVMAALMQQKDITQKELDIYLAALAKNELQDVPRKPSANDFNQVVVADKAAQNLRESLASARKQLAEEQAQLTAPYTQPVVMLEPIYASTEPVIPLKVSMSTGALLGMLLGALSLLVKRSVIISKMEPSA